MRHQFSVKVTKQDLATFRALSGDTNPLHEDDAFARSFGYREAVVFGFLSSSYYSTLVGVYLPGRFALLNRIVIDFVSPLYCHSELIVEGEIKHLTSAFRRAEIGASIRETDNRVISRAKIGVSLHE